MNVELAGGSGPLGESMRKLLLAAAILAGVVVAMFAAGTLLPRDHHAARSVLIHQPPAAIWAVITDYGAATRWRPDVLRLRPLPQDPRRDVWEETDQHGNAVPFETVAEVPPLRLVRRIADPGLPFGGTWTFDLTPRGQATLVTIREDGSVRSPMFRFFAATLMGYSGRIDTYLRNLGRRFGESVEPAPAAPAAPAAPG
jgi:uncharacterized protein YndB with AHSA1/START domain